MSVTHSSNVVKESSTFELAPYTNYSILRGPVVRKRDSAIHQIVVILIALKLPIVILPIIITLIKS